jgi:hypothetical protein
MPEIHPDMTISEILEIKPHAKDLLFDYGIYSENENVLSMETIREACENHGMDENEVDELVEKLIEL